MEQGELHILLESHRDPLVIRFEPVTLPHQVLQQAVSQVIQALSIKFRAVETNVLGLHLCGLAF